MCAVYCSQLHLKIVLKKDIKLNKPDRSLGSIRVANSDFDFGIP